MRLLDQEVGLVSDTTIILSHYLLVFATACEQQERPMGPRNCNQKVRRHQCGGSTTLQVHRDFEARSAQHVNPPYACSNPARNKSSQSCTATKDEVSTSQSIDKKRLSDALRAQLPSHRLYNLLRNNQSSPAAVQLYVRITQACFSKLYMNVAVHNK